MVFLLGWIVVALLLALWSGLLWTAHGLLAGLLSHAGTLGPGDWQLPASLAAWLPASVAEWLAALLETLAPQWQALAGSLPLLSGGATVLAWLVWGVGAVLLLGMALAAHLAVTWWRKSGQPTVAALR